MYVSFGITQPFYQYNESFPFSICLCLEPVYLVMNYSLYLAIYEQSKNVVRETLCLLLIR